MEERNCDLCGESTRKKNLGKIRGKYLCKKCIKLNRKNRMEETIDNAGIREELNELDQKIKEGYRESYKRKVIDEAPKIKGSKQEKKRKSITYLTLEDKKQLLRILLKKGLDFEEAKERLNEITEEQKRIKETMKAKNKSEEEIKIKQKELLEELWTY